MLGLFNNTTIPALEQTIMFAQRRHELLAGNLANLDTPDYRSRDLDVGDVELVQALLNPLAEARLLQEHLKGFSGRREAAGEVQLPNGVLKLRKQEVRSDRTTST